MVKRLSMFLFVCVLAFSMVAPAAAAGDGPVDINPNSPNSGGMGGVVLPYGTKVQPTGFANNLTYHGGPVMHTNTTYTIFWVPAGYTMSASYKNGMNQFLKDVAADSGLTTNVYYSDTQYYGPTSANILYQSSFGASYTDTNPYPASGCALKAGFTKCLSDAQLRKEIARVITLKKWKPNASTMFFIYTPARVRSCFGTDCSYTVYCAYHSYFGSVIYANQPFAAAKPGCSIKNATSTPPNSVAIDSTLNVMSHEHNEAITDPKLNAWWDGITSNENGDNCAWDFSAPLTAGSYNQTINGHNYVVQPEWSNSSSSCVLSGW